MESIEYNMTLQYRNHWNEWEAIREIVQNSLDEVGPGDIEIKENNGNLVIKDNGEGIKERHLLLGVSEKKSDNARGRFGEGLKMALIVLTRLGYDVTIKSGHLDISTDIYEKAGEQCLKLNYDINEHKSSYTKVIIHDYDGPSYSNRFRGINTGTKISLASNHYGDIIRSRGEGKLYVKDIYVKDLEDAQFSYNLNRIDLEESRNTVDEWDIRYHLRLVWARVGNEDLWTELFEAVKDGKWESKISFKSGSIKGHKAQNVIQKAFNNVFGRGTVLKTSDGSEREAKWRGAEVLDNSSLSKLNGVLETDQKYVQNKMEDEHELIPDNKLEDKELHILETMREIVEEQDPMASVRAYTFADNNVAGQMHKGEIRLSRSILRDMKEAIGTTIHELAHIKYSTKDMTKEHISAIQRTSASIINDYLEN